MSPSLTDTRQVDRPTGRSRLVRARRVASVVAGALAFAGCIIPGGGGISQTVPESVRAGRPAVVRLDMAVTDVKWIWGRYRDLTLHYRLVGDSVYRSVGPSRRIHVDRAHEAYELAIPAYPATTCGSIEFYVSVKLDGHPNQFEGYRTIRVVPADEQRAACDAQLARGGR